MAETDGAARMESEEKYKTLFELRDEGFCVFEMLFDADGKPIDYRFLETNDIFERDTGLYNAVGRTAREMIPTLESHWFEIYGQVALTGQPVRFENSSEAMGRAFDVYAFRLGDDDSRLVGLLFHNISDQKNTERALRASEARYRALAHASANSLYRFNADGTQLLEVYGGDFLQLSNDPERSALWLEEYVHPDDRERVAAVIRHANETHTPYEVELRGRRNDGTWIWALSRAVPVYNDAGDVVEWIGSAADISERKEAESALRASEARYRALAHSSANSLYRMTADASQLIEVYGGEFAPWDKDSGPSGSWMQDYIPVEDRAMVNERLGHAIATQTPYELEHRGRRADGSWGWTLSRAVPVRNDDGKVVEWIGSAADITERKEAEAALRDLNETLEQRVRDRTTQVQTLATSLTLAEQEERQRIAQVLHDDLQQRLYSLLVRLRLVQVDTAAGKSDAMTDALDELMSQLTQAVSVTRTLVSELNPPILATDGLAAALQWLVEYMQENYGLEVHLDVATLAEPQSVAVRTLIVQMARELLFNVVKHANTQVAWLAVEHFDGALQIHVSDRGIGFDATQVMVNPTRHSYGLRTMAERLALVGGTVGIRTAPGEGSRVTLAVPHKPLEGI